MSALNSSSASWNRAIPVATRKRLEHLCSFLESWRRKTKGETIECQRHHLKNDLLSSFKADDVRLIIALAKIERGDDAPTGCTASQLADWIRCHYEYYGKSLLDLVFEFRDLGDYLGSALEKQKQLKEAEVIAKRASDWKEAEVSFPEAPLTAIEEQIRVWMKPKAA